jgi:hypothetical protein
MRHRTLFVITAVPPRARASRQGTSLVESVIALAILLSFFYVPLGVSEEVADTTDAVTSRAHVNRQAHRVIDLLIDELAGSGTQTFTPAVFPAGGTDTLQYRRVVGAENGSALWSQDHVISVRDAPGEFQNGQDDDGDGLIDERELLITQADGDERVLVDRVAPRLDGEFFNGFDDNGNGLIDEPGFVMSREGGVVMLRLTLLGRDGAGRTYTITVESSVRMRNSVD